jgi:hypothetical protein
VGALKSLNCRLHPTAKPVGLLEFLIKTYTRPGEIVLDCPVGIGSTAKFFEIAVEVLRSPGRASA